MASMMSALATVMQVIEIVKARHPLQAALTVQNGSLHARRQIGHLAGECRLVQRFPATVQPVQLAPQQQPVCMHGSAELATEAINGGSCVGHGS
ncbi:hypothetical protein [Desulfosarcina cetonica]|uniref:hypothetical protein n=1 Tax=Desulfosarcina cetonica TaxID=90730 RepID=UPI0012ED7E76|nr:hypothetical protein [Desulfosarcina cetonica]